MKTMFLLLTTVMACSGSTLVCSHESADSSSSTENVQLVAPEVLIRMKLSECRQRVAATVNDHPNVMKQFDAFAKTLDDTYVAGEGMIHADLYRIIHAIAFSAEKHSKQTRKDSEQTPYIIHPMGVANQLMVIGKVRDPDIIIGALLHDTVEDTATSFEEIRDQFGSRVESFVREVTDDKSLEKQVRKRLQIEHAPHKSAGAAMIKLSDKLYNLSDMKREMPAVWSRERTDAYFRWGKAVVNGLPWVNAPLKAAVDNVIKDYWEANSQK